MLQKFFPNVYINSVYQIDFEQLYQDGYRGIIFDIDNTLVHHGAPADGNAIRLFARLKQIGFSCCLLSNNKEHRVKSFNDKVQVQYIYDAHKPSVSGYRKAMEQMDTDLTSTIFIGDQIFTDIFGANRTGIRSIMVRRIYWKEEIQIFFKRGPEAFVLLAYRHYLKRQGDMAPDGPIALKRRYLKQEGSCYENSDCK